MEIFTRTYFEVAEKTNYGSRTTFGTLDEAVNFKNSLKSNDYIIAKTNCTRIYDDSGCFISDKKETRKIDV